MKYIRIRWCVALLVLMSVIFVSRSHAEAPSTFKVGEFNFTRPGNWEWVEVTSPMRKAQLKVKGKDDKAAAEVVFFQFGPGSAGGVQANVNRWLGQFEEPREKLNSKVEEATIGKVKVTYVQAEGTYKSGMPGGPTTPMPDYGLLGAIMESDEGNVFIRMTGPKELVKVSVPEFKKMIQSGAKKD